MQQVDVFRSRAATAAAYLLAAGVVLFGIYILLMVTTPTVKSDGWYFVEKWLIPMQDGSLGLADLWAKRNGNHAQPITALLFLFNARFLGLDFSAETVVAIAFALGFGALVLAIARHWGEERNQVTQAWFLAFVACLTFSLVAIDKIAWSLVGLFYMGQLLGLAFLLFVAPRQRQPGAWAAFAAALGLLVLLDTSAVLWCAAAMVLLLAAAGREKLRSGTVTSRALVMPCAILAAVVVYMLAYKLLAPVPDGPHASSVADAAAALWKQPGEWWKVVQPFAFSVVHPDRGLALGAGVFHAAFWLAVVACLVAHAWTWIAFFRQPARVGVFVGLGMALVGYASIAGILVQRVPQFGMDYLAQPRYVVFFDLLWLGPALAWMCRGSEPMRALRLAGRAVPVMLVLACLAAPVWAVQAWRASPYIVIYNQAIAAHTLQLVADPGDVPEDCNPFVVICARSEEDRRRLTQALARDSLNVTSPSFRARHGIPEPESRP